LKEWSNSKKSSIRAALLVCDDLSVDLLSIILQVSKQVSKYTARACHMAWRESNVRAQNVLLFSVTTLHAEYFTDLELTICLSLLLINAFSHYSYFSVFRCCVYVFLLTYLLITYLLNCP